MKKVFSLLAVLALVAMTSSSVWAATSATKRAFASFDSVTLSIEVNLYDWVKDKEFAEYDSPKSGDIEFDVSGITPGTAESEWANATTFAKVSANLTALPANTELFLYTDNQNNSGDYQAKAATGGKYSGLIKAGNTATYQPGDHAPIRLAFAKMSDVAEGKAHHDYVSTLPNFATGGISGDARFYTTGFRNLNDRSDSGFSTLAYQERILGVSGVNGGLWVGANEAQTEQYYAGEEDVLIFFGAAFDHVTGGSSYGTETIIFGAYSE